MNFSHVIWRMARIERLLDRGLPWVLAVVFVLAAASPALAQRSPLRASGAAGPMTGVRPEVWSAARSFLTNNTDADADVLTVIAFGLEPNIQFARRDWLPAHSSMRVWIPYHGPKFSPADHTILHLETMLQDTASSATEHNLSRDEGLMLGQRDRYDNIVAMLSSRDDTDTMVIAARKSIDSNTRQASGHKATVISVSPDRISPCPQTLGDFDSLALGDSINRLDLAQMQNIRQWVQAGGTLWIIGGEVDDDQLQLLLGEAWSARIIDRTELQDFTITGRHSPVHIHTDDPVELVRMAPGENMKVLERVNGYPAAMELPLGTGRVFVTLLGPAGWATTINNPTIALSNLGEIIFSQELTPPTPAAQIAPDLVQLAPAEVGSKIVPRSLVLVVMSVFCAAFLAAGGMLLRYRRMEWFAAAGVGLAVLASAALLGEASIVNQSVPLTVATAGLMQIFPGSPSAHRQAAVAIYNPGIPGQAAGPAESHTGGLFWPTQGMPSRETVRLLFTDRDQWQWQNFDVAPGAGGMLRGTFTDSTEFSQPVGATLELAADRAQPRFEPGPIGELEDPLLAGPNGALLLHRQPDGAVAAGEADFVANDQYVFGSVLTDAQRQHQDIYRKFLANGASIDRPTLLGFASRPLPGVSVPQDAQRRDTELLSVPMELLAPPAGVTVTIPSPFIGYEVLQRFMHEGAYPYSSQRRVWNPITDARFTQQYLQFTLPRALVPMKLSAVTFDLNIHAPGREVSLLKQGGVKILTAPSPLGVVEAKLTRADLPAADSAGNILLGFTVSAATDPNQTWQVSDARITVSGEKLPQTHSDAPPIRDQETAKAAK